MIVFRVRRINLFAPLCTLQSAHKVQMGKKVNKCPA